MYENDSNDDSGNSQAGERDTSKDVSESNQEEDLLAKADDEFSLEQLSAAYAKVLKNRPNSGVDEQAQDPEVYPCQDSERSPEPMSQNRPLGDDSAGDSTGKKKSEPDDDAACPISPSSILESILFVGSPKEVKLTSRKIAAVMRDVSPKEISALAKSLNESYEKENQAYRVVSEQGVLRMELHPDMYSLQNHILGRDRATRLTQQAIDVLAIVAYNQPATREQVDQIRAIPSANILNQMVKRNLLHLELTETLPKQKLFRTTDRFLELFGLEAIDDLPQSHDVSDIDELAD